MATRALVHAGACGYHASVHANRRPDGNLDLVVHSPCTMLTDMNPDLANLPWRRGLLDTFFTSAVYKSADRHVRHVDCPVPAAMIKAAMVELGMAAPVAASIRLEHEAGEHPAQARTAGR